MGPVGAFLNVIPFKYPLRDQPKKNGEWDDGKAEARHTGKTEANLFRRWLCRGWLSPRLCIKLHAP